MLLVAKKKIVNLTKSDAKLFRRFFREMAQLRGIPDCKYQYIIDGTKEFTIHAEIQGVFSEMIDCPLIFQENPDQETTRALGWVSEMTDDKPLIVQIPLDMPNPQIGNQLYIPYGLTDELYDKRLFRITKITTLIKYPDSFICLIAPVLETSRTTQDYSDNNFNYLNV